MNKKLFKRVSISLSVLTVFTFTAPSTGFSQSDNTNQTGSPVLEDVLASDIDKIEEVSLDFDLSEEVLSEDFDLDEAVENIPSLNDMTTEERALFDEIINEQVTLLNLSEEEGSVFTESMEDFFNEETDTYHDLEQAQIELDLKVETLDNNEEYSFIKSSIYNVLGIKQASAAKVRISNKLAGALLNGAIGFAVGGGVGAIQGFILKKGKEEAKKLFTRTVVSRLKAWGAPKLAFAVGASVIVALNYLDIGNQIAKQIDKRDKRPNNGYIDFY